LKVFRAIVNVFRKKRSALINEKNTLQNKDF